MPLPTNWSDHIEKLQRYLDSLGIIDKSLVTLGVFDRNITMQGWQKLCRMKQRDQYPEYFRIPEAGFPDWCNELLEDYTPIIAIQFRITTQAVGAWRGYSVPNTWGSLGVNNLASFGLVLREFIYNTDGLGGVVIVGNKVADLTGKAIYINGAGPYDNPPWAFDNSNTSMWWSSAIPFTLSGGQSYDIEIR